MSKIKIGYIYKRTCAAKGCDIRCDSLWKKSNTCSNKCRQSVWWASKTPEEKKAITKKKSEQRKAKKDAKK